MLIVILVESFFVLVLLENKTPKCQREFLRLMSSQWPEPISESKPAGTLRILGLADSFGVVGGMTSNYQYLLQDILRRDVTPTIQMVNVSVPSYEPRHQLAILRFAMAYSPDLVLHGFFVGNDFTLFDGDMYAYRGILVKRLPGNSPYRPRHLLIRKWISNALTLFHSERERRREQTTGILDEGGSFPKGTFLKIQLSRLKEWGKRGEQELNRMRMIFPVLDSIRSTIEAGGARYIMVIHPDQTQVDEYLRREIINTFEVNEEEYDFALPQQVLMSYCADRGITCLDLLPAFQASARHGDLYLLRDTHYNQAGNELAATSISQFLQNAQLLPRVFRTTPVQVNAGE